MSLIRLAEKRLLPDRFVRYGIRRLLADRLRKSRAIGPNSAEFANWMRRVDAVTVATDVANAQHYEVPPAFFEAVLGSRLKYSCGYWTARATTLDESEDAMLRLTCERAQLADGQRILELGCGWGSLSLWMAERYPNSRITTMSNSTPQQAFIMRRAAERGFANIEMHTADIAEFKPTDTFDRVVSVEMFEHVRNYEVLLRRIRGWLHPEGRLFAHIFCHRHFAYPFDVDRHAGTDSTNWMSQHFFTGGIMPSYDLFDQFNADMEVVDRWWTDGMHYARTCDAWLDKLDHNRLRATSALAGDDNPAPVDLQLQRWRMFFMTCAELFAYDTGRQWGVGHYLMAPRGAA